MEIMGKGRAVVSRRDILSSTCALLATCGTPLAAAVSRQAGNGETFVHRDASRRPILIRGGRILDVAGATTTIASADLLVVGKKIASVAPDLHAPDATIIDATNMIVMPGFVDGHRHLWEGVIRDVLPTEDLGGYVKIVNNTLGPAYAPEDAYLGTLVSALGALDAGVTTVFDWSHIQITPAHTSATIAALREAGVRAVFGYGKPPGGDTPDSKWPNDIVRLRRDEFASTDQLLTLALATNSPEFTPDAVARAQFALARQVGAIISVHAGLEGMGKAGEIGRFGRAGLLGPDVNLVHCNTLSPQEWRIIADTGTSVSITPSSEMQMGHGIPPIQAARDVGVEPSLGVDVETSVPGDMWTQMRVAFGLQRQNAFAAGRSGQTPAPSLMTPHEVLRYATVAGAEACRLDSKIGSLEVGKEADIILLRTDLLDTMPVNDPESAVLLNMDARNVDTVLVAGRIVKRDGQMLGVDLQGLRQKLLASRDRLAQATGTHLAR